MIQDCGYPYSKFTQITNSAKVAFHHPFTFSGAAVGQKAGTILDKSAAFHRDNTLTANAHMWDESHRHRMNMQTPQRRAPDIFSLRCRGFSFSWLSVYFYFWWQAQSSQHKKGYQCSHISGKTFGSSSSSLLTAAAALCWRACDALHFSLKYPQRCSVGFRLGDILGHVIVLTFVLFWQCKLDHYHDCVVLFLKAVGDILTGGILIYPQIIMMLSVNVPLCFANCSVHCGSPGEAHTNLSWTDTYIWYLLVAFVFVGKKSSCSYGSKKGFLFYFCSWKPSIDVDYVLQTDFLSPGPVKYLSICFRAHVSRWTFGRITTPLTHYVSPDYCFSWTPQSFSWSLF